MNTAMYCMIHFYLSLLCMYLLLCYSSPTLPFSRLYFSDVLHPPSSYSIWLIFHALNFAEHLPSLPFIRIENAFIQNIFWSKLQLIHWKILCFIIKYPSQFVERRNRLVSSILFRICIIHRQKPSSHVIRFIYNLFYVTEAGIKKTHEFTWSLKAGIVYV